MAKQVGVEPRSVQRWLLSPKFQQLVATYLVEWGRLSERYPLCKRVRRVAELQRMAEDLAKIRAERAADEDIAKQPGGLTGYIYRAPHGANGVKYVRDNEMMEMEKAIREQIARELGQRTEKLELAVGVSSADAPAALAEILTRRRAELEAEQARTLVVQPADVGPP